MRLANQGLSTCIGINDKLNSDSTSSNSNNNNNNNQHRKYPLIAIMAAATTRKVDNPKLEKLALFIFLLPSLMRTLDCGFRYEYVLGYDVGDPFYDSIEVCNVRCISI